MDDIVGKLLPVRVNDRNIRSFEVDREERQAFVYKDNDGTYTVTGILAVDKKKNVLKLARPLHRCIERHESDVFQFAEAAQLVLPELEDLRLFRKYYKRCLHFAPQAAPPRAATLPLNETAAALPHAETAADAKTLPLAETAAVLPHAEKSAELPRGEAH